MPWDTSYFTSKAKKTWLQISDGEFAPYFSLGACMEGLNMLTQALYGVTLKSQPTAPGEVWADDVYKLSVMDEEKGEIGLIYCDLFNRENKPKMDCHLTIKGSKILPDSSFQVQNSIAPTNLKIFSNFLNRRIQSWSFTFHWLLPNGRTCPYSIQVP